MDFPGRTLRAVCDISTGTLTITQRPPAYTHESGALAVEVDLRKTAQLISPLLVWTRGCTCFGLAPRI